MISGSGEDRTVFELILQSESQKYIDKALLSVDVPIGSVINMLQRRDAELFVKLRQQDESIFENLISSQVYINAGALHKLFFDAAIREATETIESLGARAIAEEGETLE
jgi:hypothetical protein